MKYRVKKKVFTYFINWLVIQNEEVFAFLWTYWLKEEVKRKFKAPNQFLKVIYNSIPAMNTIENGFYEKYLFS